MKMMVSFRAEVEDYERWKAEAVDDRMTFTEWACKRLNGIVPAMPNLARVISTPALPRPPIAVDFDKGTATRAKCEHRIPPGTYCKSCEKIKR